MRNHEILVVILFVLSVYLLHDVYVLRKTVSSLVDERDAAISAAHVLQLKLENCVSDLNVANTEVSTCRQRYLTALEAISELNDLVNEYKSELEVSIDWLQRNSTLAALPSSDSNLVGYLLEQNCIRWYYDIASGERVCVLSTGCVHSVNDFLGITYRSESGDTLLSISDFYRRKGGDCEDHALFFKAEWNHLLSVCAAQPVVVESWVPSSPECLEDEDKFDWHQPPPCVQPVEWGKYIYPVVVCGAFYSPYADKTFGHCAVALLHDPLQSVRDVNQLVGAPLIEPQEGRYLGRINGDSGIYLVGTEDWTPKRPAIWKVITDKDLFVYSWDTNRWVGYGEFLDKLRAVQDTFSMSTP